MRIRLANPYAFESSVRHVTGFLWKNGGKIPLIRIYAKMPNRLKKRLGKNLDCRALRNEVEKGNHIRI